MILELTGTGTAPLLMHNGRLSDPLDPATKAKAPIAGKRQKTDEDHQALADLEWTGGLYWDENAGPYIPGENIWRAIFDAAGQQRMRPRIKTGVRVISAVNPLIYEGSRDMDVLRKDDNFRFRKSVVTQRARVIRTRPMFKQWGFQAELMLIGSTLNPEDVRRVCEAAGSQVGLGDWRPMFGTFRVERLREIA